MNKCSVKQKTIQQEVSVSGVGLHTGQQVCLTFKPANPDTGYVFKRTDLEGSPSLNAKAEYVKNTDRSTVLEHNDVQIKTTEHVLAALVGLGIDNVLIEVDAVELPIMDGSSKFFIQALKEAGIKEQEKFVDEYVVTEIINYKDPETGSEITLLPADSYQLQVMIDFDSQALGTQNAFLDDINAFETEISNARTFCFLQEIEPLLEKGLIKGGNLKNAIVYTDSQPNPEILERLKEAFDKEDISKNANGILNNLNLHHTNEAARHKLLDVVGDLALVGTRIRGKIIAYKPGHFSNTEFAKILSKRIKHEKRNFVPKFDLSEKPLMDIHKVMSLLPHRFPFLLIDRIIEMSDSHVVGMKNVTMNEPFFNGHFPGAPVMPGVLQVEAMAQAGGILALSAVPDPENYLTYFMKIDNVRFKQQVIPGDTLIFYLELITPIRRGICHMKGRAYANNKLVSEAELMAQIVKTKNN